MLDVVESCRRFGAPYGAMIRLSPAAQVFHSVQLQTAELFVLCHELGHFLLHPSSNFVDRKLIYFRDTRSGQSIDLKEIQANQFAADLLMPERFLRRALNGETVDLEDEGRVSDLSKSFGVSTQALMFRLINLNLARQI